MSSAVFFDRDGILNEERGGYTYLIEDFIIIPGIIDFIQKVKRRGFLAIVITNQAGITKNIYTREAMDKCHEYFQQQSGHLIDHFYFAPGHPSVSESLSRKPDSLLFEKAISKYGIDVASSWMIGDKERDLIPAKKLGLNTILLSKEERPNFKSMDYHVKSIGELQGLPILTEH